MDPDGIFSEKEYIQLQKEKYNYSIKEMYIPCSYGSYHFCSTINSSKI